MRGLLLPATGEPVVLEHPLWTMDLIARSLGVEFEPYPRYHQVRWRHPAPTGRYLISVHLGIHPGRGVDLVGRRPALVFAESDGIGNLAKGFPTSLNRIELAWLGVLVALRQALDAVQGDTKELY